MKFKSFFLIFLLVIFFSCIKELDFDQQENDQMLVLNGLLCPDSLVWIHLSHTTPFSSQELAIVQNAEVFLYENGEFIEQLNHSENGFYRSVSTRPLAGAAYKVVALAPDFSPVEACDTIPYKVEIESGIYQAGLSFDQYGDPHHDYTITFSDLPGSTFYELFFIYQSDYNDYINRYNICFQIFPEIADPVLQADSELDYFICTYIFSDLLFEGQTYTMYNKFQSACRSLDFSSKIVPTCYEHYAVLRTVSNAYYNYRKYWIRHSGNQQNGSLHDDPIEFFNAGNPVPMYSNVKGGYGIFAAYNQHHFLLHQE